MLRWLVCLVFTRVLAITADKFIKTAYWAFPGLSLGKGCFHPERQIQLLGRPGMSQQCCFPAKFLPDAFWCKCDARLPKWLFFLCLYFLFDEIKNITSPPSKFAYFSSSVKPSGLQACTRSGSQRLISVSSNLIWGSFHLHDITVISGWCRSSRASCRKLAPLVGLPIPDKL